MKLAASHEEQSSPWKILVLFYIRGDKIIGVIKSIPENTYLKIYLSSFLPKDRVPHFCFPPWTPFKCCWRSAAAAAHDLILVEGDGKCPFVVVLVLSCVHLIVTPMDCSMPGFSVLHYLEKFAQTHVHWVSDAIQASHPLSPPLLLLPSIFPSIRVFSMSRLFPWGG